MYSNIKYLIIVATILLVEIQCSVVKDQGDKDKPKQEPPRSKREGIFSNPIYYDPMPQQAVQPVPGAPPQTQPLPPQQQQTGLPILGALIPGFNGLGTLIPLGNLGNLGNLGLGNLGLGNLGLPNLGNLGGTLGGLPILGNLGGVGNFGGPNNVGGGLGNLGNLGGLLPGLFPGQPTQRCPVTQTLNCRCENILPLPVQTPIRSSDRLEILQQNMTFDVNGDKEISARLSNGILLYQRIGIEKLANSQKSKVIQGYYTLKLKDNKYLTIYYTINDLDYTVKADVTAQPPQNDLDASTATV